jgi:hypothetical protein
MTKWRAMKWQSNTIANHHLSAARNNANVFDVGSTATLIDNYGLDMAFVKAGVKTGVSPSRYPDDLKVS